MSSNTLSKDSNLIKKGKLYLNLYLSTGIATQSILINFDSFNVISLLFNDLFY